MHSCFLKGFNCGGLSVSESWFRAAFGKYPACAAPGLDEQELDGPAADSIADCRNLFAFAHLANLRKANRFSLRLTSPTRREQRHDTRSAGIPDTGTHCHRVHQSVAP
jgi:hypothetical protein